MHCLRQTRHFSGLPSSKLLCILFVDGSSSIAGKSPDKRFNFPLCFRLIRAVREAVAVFDWAMENMSIWASLDIESRNAKTLGRAYTCGVSNMGRYPFETQVTFLDLAR